MGGRGAASARGMPQGGYPEVDQAGYTAIVDRYQSGLARLSPEDRAAAEKARNAYGDIRFYETNQALRNPDKVTELGRLDTDPVIAGMDLAFSAAPGTTGPVRLYRGLRVNANLDGVKPGDVLTDAGYVSTSTSKQEARAFAQSIQGGGTVLTIAVDKGTKVVPGTSREKEVTLNRGTRMEVLAVREPGQLSQPREILVRVRKK